MTLLPARLAAIVPARARRDRSRGRSGRSVVHAAVATGVVLALLVPAVALAHPLGNFTINHFAGLRVAPDRVSLDVVIDRAEIPTFQERQRLDTNGDGTLQPSELRGQDAAGCLALLPALHLAVGGRPAPLALDAAGLSFPPGAGGLTTMRLVCELSASVATMATGTTLTFADTAFSERIGWREVVVLGDGVSITGAGPSSATAVGGVSNRLTAYPADLLTEPLNQRSIAVTVSPGGPPLPAWTAPDAMPLAAPQAAPAAPAGAASMLGAVPGGVGQEIAALVNVQDLTPLAILVSLAIAFALGVIHAMSPGHGKTIMAAYLVGNRGSSRQAVALGLAVTVSHTLGVLVLAGITLAASTLLPPERLYPVLGVASGGLVIAIGGSLLWQRLRAIVAAAAHRRAHADGSDHDHARGHVHAQGHVHAHGAHDRHDHGHGHSHRHEHGPRVDAISWRGLLALGLSGGLVPSASALILLLGSIAAGRVAYGIVLVVGFGIGMAVVLAGIGLLLVHARRFVERRMAANSTLPRLGRLVAPAQLATAGLVIALGVVLTGQALTQVL